MIAPEMVTNPDDFGAGPSLSFVKDIQLMLWGLGDSHRPSIATAQLIENIVIQQMFSLLSQAQEIAELRESASIGVQDILFLLRKDKIKIQRLMNYLAVKDVHVKHAALDPLNGDSGKPSKRREICLDFLEYLGIEVTSDPPDAIKLERAARADQMALTLSTRAYLDFHLSRRVTFGTSLDLLLELISSQYETDFVVNNLATDIILYLAKETVAQLVDLALLIRMDSQSSSDDPFTRASVLCNHAVNRKNIYGSANQQIEGPPAISPEEIQEVIRRYWSTQTFAFGSFTRNIDARIYEKLLAC
ncbi:unnamed protein product [Bemisia tabaci]|uniref:Uncharacterized protein n=1 Tax=Bemisia tabaci TaxID=7038 RepID=A0A9P0AH27_BEMTA|nr:unnamed protein product [Bemisia tabaci]